MPATKLTITLGNDRNIICQKKKYWSVSDIAIKTKIFIKGSYESCKKDLKSF